jgi:hypothetical protein
VWGIPATKDGYDPTGLTHIDRSLVMTSVGTDPSALPELLRFVQWGLTDDGPFWDADDQQRRIHEAEIAAGDAVDQGDLVHDSENQLLTRNASRRLRTRSLTSSACLPQSSCRVSHQ